MIMANVLKEVLILAVTSGDTEKVKSLLRGYGTHREARKEKAEALCHAIQGGHQDIIHLLLQSKSELAFSDDAGKRPIHYACELGCTDIVYQIIRAGSPVNVADPLGTSPLHYAVSGGNSDIVLLLLAEGASINRSKLQKTGETPLHFASRAGHSEMLKYMLHKGGDPDLATTEGLTPLMLAVKNRKYGICETLCKFRVNLNTKNSNHQTALHIAVEASSVEMVEMLLTHGASVSEHGPEGRTPLHAISALNPGNRGLVQIAELLLNHGADTDAKDTAGQSPLHFCAMTGSEQIASMLLEHGADINLRDEQAGNTPLCTAILYSKLNVVRLLVKAGADVNLCDNGDSSPLHKLQGVKGKYLYKPVDISTYLSKITKVLFLTSYSQSGLYHRCTVVPQFYKPLF